MSQKNRHKTTEICLAESLRSADALELKSTIEKALGGPLRLNAQDVSMLGAQCLQVLLAARAAWMANGVEFELKNLSGEMHAALGILGVPPEQIGAQGVTNGA